MKKLLLLSAIIGGLSAQAQVLTVASYPVRHPAKTTKTVLKVVFYPVAHPVKTAHYLLPPFLY